MEIVNPQGYKKLVDEAQKGNFTGWDFSWLDGRLVQEESPWDYPQLVKIHNNIEGQVKFIATAHRFLILAKKKAHTA